MSAEGANVRVLPASRPSGGAAEEWFARACELEENGDPAAVSAYERAIELDPASGDAYVNLGRLLHAQGRAREAETIYRQGILQSPRESLLHYNLGVLLDETGRRAAALQAYQEALALQDDLADCHFNIALLYEASGQPRAALRHLNAYRKLQGR